MFTSDKALTALPHWAGPIDCAGSPTSSPEEEEGFMEKLQEEEGFMEKLQEEGVC